MTDRPENPKSRDETTEELVTSFARVRAVDDPIEGALTASREAARLGLDLALYRQLYDVHGRGQRDHEAWFERLFDSVVEWCERQSFFSLLEYVGRLAILVAILSFFHELPERRQMREGEAWERIQGAEGDAWSGDRKKELERLSTSCVSIEGLPAPRARLEEIRLDGCRGPLGGAFSGTWLGRLFEPRGAMLLGADLRGAVLTRARMQRADLGEAQLDRADLSFANLAGARLRGASLVGADLFGADLSSADLTDADLTGANLGRVDLRGARLVGAVLDEADLLFADLRGADATHLKGRRANFAAARFEGVNLLGADLSRADLRRSRIDDRTIFDHVRWYEARVLEGDLSSDQLAAADDRPRLESRPRAQDEETLVGLVVPAGSHDFFRDVEAGAREEVERVGARLQVVDLETLDAETTALARVQPWLAALEESSIALAERIAVGELVGIGADAVVLSPFSGPGSDAMLRWIFESGVPVALYDHATSPEAMERWATAVYTTDQYSMGWTIGQHAARWAERRRGDDDAPWRIGLVRACDFENCFARVAGFRDALDDAELPWREIFYRRVRFGEDTREAVHEALIEHPEIEILWSANEAGTDALLDAVDRLDLGDRIRVFGTDWSDRTAAAMRRPEAERVLEAVVVQQPREMGRRAVRAALAALAALAGETPREAVVTLPHVVIDEVDD